MNFGYSTYSIIKVQHSNIFTGCLYFKILYDEVDQICLIKKGRIIFTNCPNMFAVVQNVY